MFRRVTFTCPFCRYVLNKKRSSCGRCQGHFNDLDATLSASPTPLETVMDFAKILKGAEDIEKINKSIAFSEGKFPQLKFLFCSLVCPDKAPPNLAAWWMLNRGIHSTDPSWTGLLLIDPKSRQVSFQTGYDLEVFIDLEKVEQALKNSSKYFKIEEWAQGVIEFYKELHSSLKQSHRKALRTQKKALKRISKS